MISYKYLIGVMRKTKQNQKNHGKFVFFFFAWHGSIIYLEIFTLHILVLWQIHVTYCPFFLKKKWAVYTLMHACVRLNRMIRVNIVAVPEISHRNAKRWNSSAYSIYSVPLIKHLPYSDTQFKALQSNTIRKMVKWKSKEPVKKNDRAAAINEIKSTCKTQKQKPNNNCIVFG